MEVNLCGTSSVQRRGQTQRKCVCILKCAILFDYFSDKVIKF